MEESLKGLNIDWSQYQATPELVDQMMKLNCLEFATRNTSFIDPLQIAKEMYDWVKANSDMAQPNGEKWNETNEVKYSYDLTGCVGYKTGVANEPKQ